MFPSSYVVLLAALYGTAMKIGIGVGITGLLKAMTLLNIQLES
jgi:hypothetical protein